VSIYVDHKKEEKTAKMPISDEPFSSLALSLPRVTSGRRFSMATVISDYDGGEDLSTDRQEVAHLPRSTSSRRNRKGVGDHGEIAHCFEVE